MKSVLNHLVQLQELQLAVAERQASSTQMPSDGLDRAIADLVKRLPADVANRYERLQKRHPIVVVPVVHGTCSMCAISLPVALVNDVKAAEAIQSCPHCGRFLFFPESVTRQAGRKTGSSKMVLAGIARFSCETLMAPSLKASTREESVKELAELMTTGGFIENAQTVVEQALQREAIVSTAVEHGLAFPHVRNAEGGGLTLALGMKPKGIEFGAPDEKLTRLIFLIVIPAPSSAFYLRLLAGLVKTFSSVEARKMMLDCETSSAMWKTLVKLTRPHIV